MTAADFIIAITFGDGSKIELAADDDLIATPGDGNGTVILTQDQLELARRLQQAEADFLKDQVA